MKTFRKYLNLFCISLGASCIFKLAMIKDVYYDDMQAAFNATNVQMGLLITFFAITQALAYLPGGWLVDLVPVKYLMPVGLIGTGLLGFWEATFPSYEVLLVIQMGYGLVITLMFWDAMIKGTRMLAADHAQGKMFGMLEGVRGACATAASFGSVWFFAKLGEGMSGLRSVMIYYSVILCTVGVLVFLFMEKNEVEGKVNAKQALQGLVQVAKLPKVWLAGGIVFFGYSFYSGLGYMTPMLTNVFGMSATLGATVGTIKQYMIAIFAAPLGGMLADKMGSRVKFLRYVMIIGAVIMAAFIISPSNEKTVALGIALMLLSSAVTYMMRGTYYSTTAELGISVTMTGAAAGVLSLVGNTPDFFSSVLYGSMLDLFPGAAGYKAIFGIMLAFALCGCLCAVLLGKTLKKESMQKGE